MTNWDSYVDVDVDVVVLQWGRKEPKSWLTHTYIYRLACRCDNLPLWARKFLSFLAFWIDKKIHKISSNRKRKKEVDGDADADGEMEMEMEEVGPNSENAIRLKCVSSRESGIWARLQTFAFATC